MSKHARPAPEEPGDASTSATSAGPSALTTSLTATSSEQGRAYQANRDQTINEQHHQHHHYGPRSSLKAGLTWALASATILALGAFVGVDLLERHAGADASPPGDAHPVASLSPSSAAPTPTGSATATASPSPTPSETAERQAAAPTAPQAMEPPPFPDNRCRAWTDTEVATVQFRSCSRMGDDGYMYIGAEWRTTSGHQRADIYVWLKDSTGAELVYPDVTMGGLEKANADIWESPKSEQQWIEYKVDTELQHGVRYMLLAAVKKPGNEKPAFNVPEPRGFQMAADFL